MVTAGKYRFAFESDDPMEVQLLVTVILHELNARGIGSPATQVLGPAMDEVIIPRLLAELGPKKCKQIIRTWSGAGIEACQQIKREIDSGERKT